MEHFSINNKNTLSESIIIYIRGMYDDFNSDKFVKNEIIEIKNFLGKIIEKIINRN